MRISRRNRSAPRVSGNFRPYDLDGDFAVVLEVAGQPDGRHAAASEHTLKRVPIAEGVS